MVVKNVKKIHALRAKSIQRAVTNTGTRHETDTHDQIPNSWMQKHAITAHLFPITNMRILIARPAVTSRWRGSRRTKSKYDFDDFRDTDALGGSTGPFGVKMPMARDLRMKPQPHDPATQARFVAYKLVGKNMTRTYIVEKPDQDFQKYATAWERQHSKILYKLPSRESIGATPIVDDTLTVVGHLMTVSGRRLFTPVELYSISPPV